MKLLVSTTTLVVLLCVVVTVFESEAAHRRNHANDLRRRKNLQLRRSASDIDFNEPQMTQGNSGNEQSVYHQYSNIITGKLFLRVGQSLRYLITMIEHLRDLLVQYQWHILAGAVDYWIQVLKRRLDYENSMAAFSVDDSHEQNQNQGYIANYPCQPYDVRAGC